MESFGALLKPHCQQLQHIVIVLNCVKLFRSLKIVSLLKVQLHGNTLSLTALLGALILAVLGIRLAQLSEDPIMINIHSTNLVLNMTYLVILYRYSTPEHKLWIFRNFLSIVMLIVLCLWYSLILEDPMGVKYFLNIVRTGTTSLLIIMSVVQRSCAFWGSFVSMLLAISKLLYALSIESSFMLYQSLIVLSLVLLRSFYIFLKDFSNISKPLILHSSRDPSTTELKGVSTKVCINNGNKEFINTGPVQMCHNERLRYSQMARIK